MTELLPCPFCGCTAIYVTHTHYYDDEDTVCMFCNGCKSIVILENNEAEGINDKTRAEAIAAWNTRAERVGERKTINKTGDFVTHDSRAERTCTNVDKYASSGFFICGNCGFGDNAIELTPNYCPNCGCKVVGE